MGALIELIMDIILTFRVTRWLFGLGIIALVVWTGGLVTTGGWTTIGLMIALIAIPEFFAARDRK